MSKREGGPSSGPALPGGAVQRDANNPVHFGAGATASGPFIDPRVNDPSAMRYAQQVEGRRRPAANVPRYSEPVAGGPDVAIPRLDGEAQHGMTMAEQAMAQRGVFGLSEQPAAAAKPSGIVVPPAVPSPAPPSAPASVRPPSVPASLRNGDMLPAQAQNDPQFRAGHGSMFAVNQPHLADKYGVMRNGEWVAPQRLRSTAPTPQGQQRALLSQETVAGLKALEDFQAQRDNAESGAQVEQAHDVEASPARAVGATEARMTDSDKKELLDSLDDFDLNRVKTALFKDLLNNEEQKKLIESRLKPLDLTDLITKGRVTQVVPIREGFAPEFQSYSGDEDLVIKRLISEEADTLKPSDRYLLDKYTLMGVTIAIRSINKMLLPDYRDANGAFNEEAFWKKYNLVSRWDYHMLASLMINWFWFDMRVRQLFKADTLGNG